MNSHTLDIINERLKNESQETLELVLNYLNEITHDNTDELTDFELTPEDKEKLLEIKNRPLIHHSDFEVFINDMQTKYQSSI